MYTYLFIKYFRENIYHVTSDTILDFQGLVCNVTPFMNIQIKIYYDKYFIFSGNKLTII